MAMTTFIQGHQTLYWTGILCLALVCCAGWYYFGATRLDSVALASAGKQPPALAIAWRFKPFAHSLTFHLANLIIVVRLEANDVRIGAGIEMQFL
jgi:hypothetical protein